ncbi:hypothetical protein [Chitinophaga sp. Cy-1792]|uniref:hypothetical protein n=1 Tax=Chitinophaga sp. Cy-1792 TaxID=2608339 RepID=UPI00141E7D63|nr:hypothetical protein [Chitinophaga sp. Cy-1792]NIG54046.1 hypothetical protein [Chitinophaga sp. Cy-1792]
MSFFNRKTTWTNTEFIPFKLCIASIYVIVGAYFHEFFSRYYILWWSIFAVTVIWTVALWLKKMKQDK